MQALRWRFSWCSARTLNCKGNTWNVATAKAIRWMLQAVRTHVQQCQRKPRHAVKYLKEKFSQRPRFENARCTRGPKTKKDSQMAHACLLWSKELCCFHSTTLQSIPQNSAWPEASESRCNLCQKLRLSSSHSKLWFDLLLVKTTPTYTNKTE